MQNDLNFKLEYAIRQLNLILDMGIAGHLDNLNLGKLAADIEMLETQEPSSVEPCFDRFNIEIKQGEHVNYEGRIYLVKNGKFGLFITIDNTDTRVASLYQHKLECVKSLLGDDGVVEDKNGIEIREGHQVLYKGLEHVVFSGKQGLSISIDWEETPISSLSQCDLEIF